LVGANGSGKSSLFEFLRFFRDSVRQDIPPEIVPGAIGQQIFHSPGPERFQWIVDVSGIDASSLRYEGELMGPVGRAQVSYERVTEVQTSEPRSFLSVTGGRGSVGDPVGSLLPGRSSEFKMGRLDRLVLGTITNPAMSTLYNLREYILGWRFYSSLNLVADKLRRPVLVDQQPLLHEDGGNLSSVLFYLLTDQRPLFEEMEEHLRSVIPGFRGLTVKSRGAPGEVMAFWKEKGVDSDLSLADLSDGILRLICWVVLCVHPNPPTLICIDEPDLGVHPRTLPVLAGLFEKASSRTQFLLATHASYLLMQFEVGRIAVMRKNNGRVEFLKPADSRVLRQSLTDFGPEEMEAMHRSDELERLA